MARKKYFFVFCAIFLTVIGILGLGAWRAHQAAMHRAAAQPAAPASR